MGFSRQEYWSGLPLPSPGDLPDPGIKPRSPALEADALTSEPPGKPPLCLPLSYCLFSMSHKLSRKYTYACVLVSVLSHFSHVRLFANLWIVACQAPLSLGFSRQEYWSGLPLPSPGDLPDPGIEPGSPTLEADALTREAQSHS